MLKKIGWYILRGIFVLFPVLVLYGIISLLHTVMSRLVPFASGALAVIIGLAVVAFVGWFTSQPLATMIDTKMRTFIFQKAPILGSVFNTIKRATFFKNIEKRMKQPVLIERGHEKRIGFLTHEKIPYMIDNEDYCAVLLPHAFALQSEVILISKEHITHLDMTTDQALSFLLSGTFIEHDTLFGEK